MTFTVAEAAAALRVSPGTVYNLCARRLLRYERYGVRGRGVIRIPADALAEFRERSTVVEKAAAARPPAPVLASLKHLKL